MQPKRHLVIDFEASCYDRETVPREHMEIIEMGAVIVEGINLQMADEFQCFIRPIRYPKLTAFCTHLTSIKQQDVDEAPLFREAVSNFKGWLYRHNGFVFCSWGDYDMKHSGKTASSTRSLIQLITTHQCQAPYGGTAAT